MSNVKERVERCIKVLQNSKSTKERKDAVKELNSLGFSAEAALPELMKIINRKEDFSIQSLAEEAIVKIGEPAIPALKKLLKSPIRTNRLKGLGLLGDIAHGDKEVVDEVLHLIKPLVSFDINYQVRLNAISIIKKLAVKFRDKQNIVELLGNVLRTDRNYLVRKEAGKALGEIKGKLAIFEVIKSMDRKSYPFFRLSGEARVEAANALYQIAIDKPKDIKEHIPFFLDILENDSYIPMRISVLIPLIMSGGWNIIEDVLNIIVKDKWLQVRMSALETADLLLHQKTSRSKMKSILPLLKKIAREDKYEYVQDSARDLIEGIEELLKEEEEGNDD
ncbi:MAG: HEAT repeat domain-containing protein [Candidatus Heimdallarchaeota archaeon]|nr:HEAT repeat domain-containing protein [Candidatus Heimdallarchaeota archaeon]